MQAHEDTLQTANIEFLGNYLYGELCFIMEQNEKDHGALTKWNLFMDTLKQQESLQAGEAIMHCVLNPQLNRGVGSC
eukprot:12089276-Karenia_brevis.AAC.1